MKLIDNYLSKNILFPTITIILILSSIILITQSLKYVDLIVSHGTSASDFLYITILLLPSLLSIIIPICLFIGILYSLNQLNANRELNILKGVGINNFNISKPILKVAILITVLHYFLSLYLTPVINNKFKDLTKDLKENYVTFFLQEKVFNHPTKFITFYIKNKISNTKFEQIFYQDTRRPDSPVTFIAKSGELFKKNNKLYLNLNNGNRQEINNKGEFVVLSFDRLLVQLDFSKDSIGIRELTIQERNMFQLFFPEENTDLQSRKRMLSEANYRIIWPFYNIILTLIAIYIFLFGEFNRKGKTKRIIIFSCFAGILIILNNSIINLSTSFPLMIILSYLLTFGIFGILAYQLFYRKINDLYQFKRIYRIFRKKRRS
ncbi:MAG: LptF/LptG family permease [Pseudomonadota bacterium]|mgnify:CR=1 FL=1